MSSNAQNTKRGNKGEDLFKNTVKKQPEAIQAIKEALNISGNDAISKSYRTGSDKGKADVIINFGGGEYISANVKSYGSMGFNQATRANLYKFADTFNLPDYLQATLKNSIIRKAENRREPFILPEDAPAVVEFFKKKAKTIIKHSLCGDESPELFVLYNRKDHKMHIYLMSKLLAELNHAIDVKITARGVIQLSKYFTIQKKGGNGIHDKREKTDINYGGNHLQVKIKPIAIEKDFEPLYSYTP